MRGTGGWAGRQASGQVGRQAAAVAAAACTVKAATGSMEDKDGCHEGGAKNTPLFGLYAQRWLR